MTTKPKPKKFKEILFEAAERLTDELDEVRVKLADLNQKVEYLIRANGH